MSLTISILEIINESDVTLSLKDIQAKVKHLRVQLRTIQRAIKGLTDANRIQSIGAASSTVYWQKDVRQAYTKRYRMLFVHKKDEVAGYLFHNHERYVFCYTDEYLIENAEAIPGIPLSIDSLQSEQLPVAFDENLPEGINREIFENALRSGDEFDMLARLSHNIGDIYFTLTDEPLMPFIGKRPSFLSNAPEILGVNIFPSVLEHHTIDLPDSEIFPEGEDLSRYSRDEMPGISGFQYKKLLNYNREGKRFYQDGGDEIRDYIFKPYSRIKSDPSSEYYLPHLAINEHLFMTFAKNELGFRAPESHLIKGETDAEYHYVVKRFDRFGAYRFGKANFSTYLGLRAANKYETTSEKMFKRIKQEIISPKERMELLKYYFYSMVISHEDMHTKNLSLLIDGGVTLLAPLYDVACTRIYSNTKGYDTYLTINGQRTNITPRHFRVLVDILDVPYKEFMKEAQLIVERYREVMPLYVESMRSLGDLEFYTMKQVVRPGRAPEWKKGIKKDFVDVMQMFVAHRSEELQKLGWGRP